MDHALHRDIATFPYDAFIDGLEEAIYWHNDWYARGMRLLLQRLPASDDLLAHDAHTHCKLAGLLKNLPTPPGHEVLMQQIKEMHHEMHALMREALLEAQEGVSVSETTLDEMEQAQSSFFVSLHGLFRQVLEDKFRRIAS